MCLRVVISLALVAQPHSLHVLRTAFVDVTADNNVRVGQVCPPSIVLYNALRNRPAAAISVVVVQIDAL